WEDAMDQFEQDLRAFYQRAGPMRPPISSETYSLYSRVSGSMAPLLRPPLATAPPTMELGRWFQLTFSITGPPLRQRTSEASTRKLGKPPGRRPIGRADERWGMPTAGTCGARTYSSSRKETATPRECLLCSESGQTRQRLTRSAMCHVWTAPGWQGKSSR